MRLVLSVIVTAFALPACAATTLHQPPPQWSVAVASPLPGVVVIASASGQPVCSGSVIDSEAGRSLVLTDQSCLADPGVRVAVPEGSGWAHYPIARTYEHGSAPMRAQYVGPRAQWVSSWAVAEIATPAPLPVLPLASQPPQLHVGDEVALESYFGSDTLAPHVQPFRWGDKVAAQLLHQGRFGAPLVRDGQIVGVFCGATAHLPFGRFTTPQADEPMFTAAETIREEAQDRGLALVRAQ